MPGRAQHDHAPEDLDDGPHAQRIRSGHRGSKLGHHLWPQVPIAGLQVPAGAFFAGLVFTVRNLLQDAAGSKTALLSVAAGAALSGLVASPHVAVASAAAFAISETADFAIYSPLRRRRPIVAMALSNTVGSFLDSLVFLLLAFDSLTLFVGQVAGKAVTTVLAVSVLTCARAGRQAATT